jgi:magnesium transporter
MNADNVADQWRSEAQAGSQRLIEIYIYREGSQRVELSSDVSELAKHLADPSTLVWVDLHAETHEEKKRVEKILLETFKFHHLSVEDCLETRNQPKVEAFPNYLFFIVHGIKPAETSPVNFVTKELDGYLGTNFVVTFHLEGFRSIAAVKQQILSSPFICQRGAAYLLHQILDQLVDHYMPLVDEFDTVIEEIETRVLDPRTNDSSVLEEIMDLRRSIARLRRIATRQREVLYRISHGEFPQIDDHVLPFFRDVHDHLLRVPDLSENYRDLVAGLVEIHFSVVANKTNDVMKTLAVVSAIILPLSLIAGIYGMNFAHMPELENRYGYFLTLGSMAFLAVILLVYFRRRGWIFQGSRPERHIESSQKNEL